MVPELFRNNSIILLVPVSVRTRVKGERGRSPRREALPPPLGARKGRSAAFYSPPLAKGALRAPSAPQIKDYDLYILIYRTKNTSGR